MHVEQQEQLLELLEEQEQLLDELEDDDGHDVDDELEEHDRGTISQLSVLVVHLVLDDEESVGHLPFIFSNIYYLSKSMRSIDCQKIIEEAFVKYKNASSIHIS